MWKAISLWDLVFAKLVRKLCMNKLWQKQKTVYDDKTRRRLEKLMKKWMNSQVLQDKRKVFLSENKARIVVAMDRYECDGDEKSYEYKMKQVLVDFKAKAFIRAYKDRIDLTEF